MNYDTSPSRPNVNRLSGTTTPDVHFFEMSSHPKQPSAELIQDMFQALISDKKSEELMSFLSHVPVQPPTLPPSINHSILSNVSSFSLVQDLPQMTMDDSNSSTLMSGFIDDQGRYDFEPRQRHHSGRLDGRLDGKLEKSVKDDRRKEINRRASAIHRQRKQEEWKTLMEQNEQLVKLVVELQGELSKERQRSRELMDKLLGEGSSSTL